MRISLIFLAIIVQRGESESCDIWTFTCHDGFNITANKACFDETYSALDLKNFHDVNNKDQCRLEEKTAVDNTVSYKVEFSFNDTECIKNVTTSDDNITYTIEYYHHDFDNEALFSKYQIQHTVLNFTFACTFYSTADIFFNASVVSINAVPVTDNLGDENIEPPVITVNGESSGSSVGSASRVKLDYTESFPGRGQYRLKKCTAGPEDDHNRLLIVNDHCLLPALLEIVKLDPFGQWIETRAFVFDKSQKLIIKCTIRYCETCKEESNEEECNEKANQRILTQQRNLTSTYVESVNSQQHTVNTFFEINYNNRPFVEVEISGVTVRMDKEVAETIGLLDNKSSSLVTTIPSILLSFAILSLS